MKVIWTGSDSLFLIMYPPGTRFRFRLKIFVMRRFTKILDYFAEEHYVDSPNLKDNLLKFGIKKPIKIVPDNLKYSTPVKKKKHNDFNILYYYPSHRKKNVEFVKWLYGYDIYSKIKQRLHGVNWIVVDGKQDMSKIFPIIDFYLRPNRHDGASRLRQECELNNIPYYWTQSNPSVNDAIEEINKWKKENIS